jgi:catechol 2,3-dioxygenase-like lactoylglutathione lyase family enzyme
MEISRRTVLGGVVAAMASADALCATKASKNSQEIRMTALHHIRHLDYTILFARDMDAMRDFYGSVMEFEVNRDLSRGWIEYRVGSNLVALTEHGVMFDDPKPQKGALSAQLAFRVTREQVDECAEALTAKGVELVSGPADQPWGHRTLFFRDPDGNVLEIYADI